jgi:hypothetical protein
MDVDLFTANGRRKGRVLAFAEGALKIEKVFMINGRPAGTTRFSVRVDELTPATLARLAPQRARQTPVDWIGATLRALAAGDPDGAEAALGNVGEHVLGKALAAQILRSRVGVREAAAHEAWARLEERSRGTLTREDAAALLRRLNAFTTKHGETDFAASNARRIEDLKGRLTELGWDATGDQISFRLAGTHMSSLKIRGVLAPAFLEKLLPPKP